MALAAAKTNTLTPAQNRHWREMKPQPSLPVVLVSGFIALCSCSNLLILMMQDAPGMLNFVARRSVEELERR
jgi:hypothetical protein